MSRLTQILGNARSLAVAAMMGDKIDQSLAEEVSGELSEFIAYLENDRSMDSESICTELQALALAINKIEV